MKKVILTLAAFGLLTLASCDTKECRCYEKTATRWVRTTATTTVDNDCKNLNTSTFVCDEMTDPDFDPNDIAFDKKKK